MFWNIVLNGDIVDTVWFTEDCDSRYVKHCLVNREGFPSCIGVYLA